MSEKVTAADPPARRRRWLRYVLISVVALALLVISLPWIVASTPLRHAVVQAVIDHPQLQASVDRASFGWFRPLELDRLAIDRPDGYLRLDVERFRAQHSWLQLWMRAPDLGDLTIDRPTVDAIPGATWEPIQRDRQKTLLVAEVNSARVLVRSQPGAPPVIDIRDVSARVHIAPHDGGRMLVVEPVAVFERQRLTPELCDQGLQLVAPILSQAADVEGEVSFRLDGFRLPLDQVDPVRRAAETEIQGLLELHQVSTSLENPVIRSISQLITAMLGLEIPETIEVVENTSVAFDVKDGRVHHQGMAFMLPDLSEQMVIRTSGSVGFDETLDLLVEVRLPVDLLTDGPLARRLSEKPISVRVAGTLDKPKLQPPDRGSWLNQFANLLLRRRQTGESDAPLPGGGDPQAGDAPLAESLLDAVGTLLDNRDKDDDTEGTTVLDRVRKWRERRAKARAEAAADSKQPRKPPARGRLFGGRDKNTADEVDHGE